MNLQEAQGYIRGLIKALYWCDLVRPTSIKLTETKYKELSNLTNPFNMNTISWLEQTCNITIVKESEVTQLDYKDILDRL